MDPAAPHSHDRRDAQSSRPNAVLQFAARLLIVTSVALLAANCAQQKLTSGKSQIDPKYGVKASPRVVGENDPVPKGGGRKLVGKPYVVAGRVYVPREDPRYAGEGMASWYGTAFHGRLTANGEIFDRWSLAAAHPTMPLPSYARVTNAQNNRSIIVRVNDRGPYHADRIMDVSQRVAEALDFKRLGTTRVRVEYVGRASTGGSDDEKLLATLRTDGGPALFPGRNRTMVADLSEPAQALPRQALAFRETLPPQLPQPTPVAEVESEPELEPTLGPVRVAAPVMPVVTAHHAPAPEPLPLSRAPAPETPAVESRVVARAPLPPGRPLDLGNPHGVGAAHNSRTPVAQALPPLRPVYARL